jgi:hypothetical protein
MRYGMYLLASVSESQYEHYIANRILPQTEVTVSGVPEPKSIEDVYTKGLTEAEAALAKNAENASARITRGFTHMVLGHDQQALDDFSTALQKDPNQHAVRGLRAVLLARLNRGAEAHQELLAVRKDGRELVAAPYEAQVAAWLGEPLETLSTIESQVKANPRNSAVLFSTAQTYAKLADILARRDAQLAGPHTERALALLRKARDNSPRELPDLRMHPDFQGLRDHAGFRELFPDQKRDREYSELTQTSPGRDSRESHGLTPEDHLRQCRQFMADGCRPQSISISALGAGKPVVTASVWHRPIVSHATRDEFAERQALATLVLMRLDEATSALPKLRGGADPRVRTVAIQRLATGGIKPETLVEWLYAEADPSARQGLLLALAGYSAGTLPPAAREAIVPKLIKLYRTDPDSGVHSGVDWLLRQWYQGERLRTLDQEMAAVGPAEVRRWYVNRQGQTLAVVPGPVEFLMGSPTDDPLTAYDARRHRRRIGRTFAIATRETTFEQFDRFLSAHPEVAHADHRRNSADPSNPVGAVTWFEAAKYCRWLSEQEGLTEDQMCFPPLAEIKLGMSLPENFIERIGYRLPTEAEWEFACRAGSETPYSFGSSPAVLGEYAWFKDNSAENPRRVGLQRPNVLGAFDMHGNLIEWCHNPYLRDYPESARGAVEDDVFTRGSVGPALRVLRGGSYNWTANLLTSAHRTEYAPETRYNNGFRVARTLATHPLPATDP